MYTSKELADIYLSTTFSNKNLGQNFIIDDSVIESISDLAELSERKKRKILEIGLGPGALTQKLLQFGHNVLGVEIDGSICEHLRYIFQNQLKLGQLELVNDDILNFKIPSDVTDIIANIPYQISSPLLEKITQYCETKNILETCVFMFQEEFAQRIFVSNNSSNKGTLWITTALDWDVRLSRKISPSSFKPQPKVESRLVFFKRRELLKSDLILEMLNNKNLVLPSKKIIRAISSASFNQRRKKLRNSLKRQPSKLKSRHGFNPKHWEFILNKSFFSMGDDFSSKRPEEISLEKWIEFSAQIAFFREESKTLN